MSMDQGNESSNSTGEERNPQGTTEDREDSCGPRQVAGSQLTLEQSDKGGIPWEKQHQRNTESW